LHELYAALQRLMLKVPASGLFITVFATSRRALQHMLHVRTSDLQSSGAQKENTSLFEVY
jgi:hypothetical protein